MGIEESDKAFVIFYFMIIGLLIIPWIIASLGDEEVDGEPAGYFVHLGILMILSFLLVLFLLRAILILLWNLNRSMVKSSYYKNDGKQKIASQLLVLLILPLGTIIIYLPLLLLTWN